MKLGKRIATALLGVLCISSLAGGLSACKAKKKPVDAPQNTTTVRMALPDDGSLPTAHTALENVGYMATVLDGQEAYKAYAHASSKAMGYEQITQTWKDYKGKSLSGYDTGVMICSDLTYSAFVKAGTQSCFVNNEAYMRSSSKPGKNTTGTTAEWSTSQPEYYNKNQYLEKYGEFSTELTVYVINEDTLSGSEDIVDNGDGTYSQKMYLNESAACYYQYGMKTRGNLKGYPSFEHIEITFTFDSGWKVLSTYCEERTKIAPKAMGGTSMTSNSKTTNTFAYGEENIDAEHYGYFDSYYKAYVGSSIVNPGNPDGPETPDMLDVLAGGFSGVLDGGQQFALDLKLGDTDYNGKIYAKLGDLGDVLNSLDVRLALSKAGTDTQDLYVDFGGGNVNAYYGENFAMTANLDATKTSINQFSAFIKEYLKRFEKPDENPAPEGNGGGNGGGGVNIDLSSLLSELKFTYTDTSCSIAINSDNLLGLGVGVNVALNFDRTIQEDGSSEFAFKNASISSITYENSVIKLSGSLSPDSSAVITRDKAATPANLADYVTGIQNLLGSDTYKVTLGIDGGKQNAISYLKDLSLNATAYAVVGSDISAKVDLDVTYSGLSVSLSAYYGINIHSGNLGKVYINLTKINEENFDAKIYCDIKNTETAVRQLISTIQSPSSSNGGASVASASLSADGKTDIASIINGVLSLNFSQILGDMYANNSYLKVSVNLDDIMGALGIDLNGLKFGTGALTLNLDSNKKANLALSLAALGLDMSVYGVSDAVAEPADKANYLNVEHVINLINTAAQEANKIIAAKDIKFDIDATVTADNVPLSVRGSGEADWSTGKVRFGADLLLSVADGTTSALKDSVAIKFVFDDGITDDTLPFVKLSINGIAFEIYRNDIEEVKGVIKEIQNSIQLLINGPKENTGDANSLVRATLAADGTQATGNIITEISEILASENVQKILNAVLGYLGDFEVKLGYDEGNVKTLIVNYASSGSLTLGADGKLSLSLIADVNGAKAVDLSASVKAGNGSSITAVRASLDAIQNVYSTATAGEYFTKIAYNYLFAVVEDLSITNVLGTKTYSVHVNLNGGNSAISQLKGINVAADVHYREMLDGAQVAKKLAEVDALLDIKGTEVKVNARYMQQTVYVSLEKVGATTLEGIKFKAGATDIYEVVEEIVNIITDQNILDTLVSILHPTAGGATGAAKYALTAVNADGGVKSVVEDILNKLFAFDFEKALSYKHIDGVNVAVINPDYILETLGVNAPKIGTITAKINPATHKIEAEAKLAQNDSWLTLVAEAAQKTNYPAGWTDEYIDLGFIDTLLKDLKNTFTDNDTGEVHTLYTFSGSANITLQGSVKVGFNIPINANIGINVKSLTAGVDKNGDFYFSLFAHLNGSKAEAAGISTLVLTEERDICINYSNGYITLGRELDSSPKYKVMTLDYLLDNMFNKNENGKDSPIRWLIGMNGTVWNILAGNFNVSSGLTKPETYYLYNSLSQAGGDNSSAFKLADIINGLNVMVNGEQRSSTGTGDKVATELGLTDNYYGLDFNAGKLTGNILQTLYLGVYRSDAQGIYGLKAKLNLDQAGFKIGVTLDINKYHEGATEDTAVENVTAAPNYFDNLQGNIDFNHEFTDLPENTTAKFGCYNTEDGSYEASYVLSRVNLTVVGLDGNIGHEVDLPIGSTVYLRNPFSPTWANGEHTQKIVYTDIEGNKVGTADNGAGGISFVINADTVIYAKAEDTQEIKFNLGVKDGGGNIMVVSGAFANGDELLEYPLSGYTFDGWYNDAGFENRVYNESEITNTVNGVKYLYGYFVRGEVTVNGVVYAFDKDTRTYYVKTFVEEQIQPYTVSGSTLVLESEIDGYAVTKIGASALYGSFVKNVIVPANITTVEKQAFRDNYGIESVAFLADTVHLGGTSSAGDTDRYVFFGCSEADGGTTTKLKIYYHNLTNEDASNWNCFRTHKPTIGSTTYYRIGTSAGGSLINSGWTYAEYETTGVKVEGLNLTSGIKTDAKTAEVIKAEIDALIKADPDEYGEVYCINAYEVNVSNGYVLDGSYNKVTVDIQNATPYYRLTIDSNVLGAIVDGEVEVYDGTRYVKAGTEVTVNAPDGYEFTSLTGYEHTDGKFVMPERPVALTAVCEKTAVAQYTLNSAVPFSLDGTDYASSATFDLEETSTLSAPTAVGYTFMGWTYNNGRELEFVSGDTVEYNNYYAVWAVNRTEVTAVSTLTSGTDPNGATVTVDTAKAHSFCKWYTDNTFMTEVTALSTSTTVLYARLNYTLTYNLNGNGNTYFFVNAANTDNKNNASSTGNSYSSSIAVLEGTAVTLILDDNNTRITITNNGVNTELRAKKVGTFGVVSSSRTFTLQNVNAENGWDNNQKTVTGNMDVTATF